MCGILACLGISGPPDRSVLETASRKLAHRGPDGAGFALCGRAGLAHRRLAIIDPEHGDQPLASEDGRVVACVNGAIYNHAQLRAELAPRHGFGSGSDSEVVVHLFEDQGAGFVRALDGMYAFVASDGERVVAGRDPLGIKPLYHGRDAAGNLWLASELKALIGKVDRIEALPPGAVLASDSGVTTWFKPPWLEPEAEALPFEPDELLRELGRAVEKRLMSDVPVGVLLSGGLDSCAVAALARRGVPDLPTFAVGLADSADLAAARVAAASLGTRHRERAFTVEEAADLIEPVIASLESYDPALIRSAIPCWVAAELAAEDVKVVLTGEGADEVFGGYDYMGALRDPAALHRELVRLLRGLHAMNLQRVDRMTMAHGVEARVPFLDLEFLEYAMGLDPGLKLQAPDRPEKWCLRAALHGLLPGELLWRSKQEFAEGCHAGGVVAAVAEEKVSDRELARAGVDFPVDPPTTKEELYCRRVFASLYPTGSVEGTVARWITTSRGGTS